MVKYGFESMIYMSAICGMHAHTSICIHVLPRVNIHFSYNLYIFCIPSSVKKKTNKKINSLTLIEHQNWIRHIVKHFLPIDSFNPHSNQKKMLLFSSLLKRNVIRELKYFAQNLAARKQRSQYSNSSLSNIIHSHGNYIATDVCLLPT